MNDYANFYRQIAEMEREATRGQRRQRRSGAAWERTPEATQPSRLVIPTADEARQLEIENQAEAEAARARSDYSPLPDEAGLLVPIAAMAGDLLQAPVDAAAASAGNPEAQRRLGERDRRWARGMEQAGEDILAEGHGGQFIDWLSGLPDDLQEAERARLEAGGENSSSARMMSALGGLWTGMAAAPREARGRMAAEDVRQAQAGREWEIENARGTEAFNRSDFQAAGEADIAARLSARTGRQAEARGDIAAGEDFWYNAPWAVEFFPEFGMVQSLARFPARRLGAALGQDVSAGPLARPNYLSETQRPGVRTGESRQLRSGDVEDVLYSATGNARGWRNNAALGGAAYLGADAIDGEMGDDPTQNAMIAGGAMAYGRRFIPNIDSAIPDDIQHLMRQGEIGPDGARNYTPRPRQRLTVDPEGRVAMDYEGSFNTGDGATIGETRSVMRGAREALDQDIAATRRSEYSWTPNDERQAALYRSTFERDTPTNYAFSETPQGEMRLRRLGAEFEPDPIQAERVADDAPFGFEGATSAGRIIDAEATPAPQRRFEAAVRDPETGRVYTGQDHVEAIDSAPDESVRARLQAAYDAADEDPRVIGFQVNGQFMGREDGLAALRERAGRGRQVRIGEQVNADGSVTPRSPIDWDADVAPERSALRDLGIASATGAVIGGGVGSLMEGDAEASDGSEGGIDWTLPILGGLAGAASLPIANRLLRNGSRDIGYVANDVGAARRLDAPSAAPETAVPRVDSDPAAYLGSNADEVYDRAWDALGAMDSRRVREMAEQLGISPHDDIHTVRGNVAARMAQDHPTGLVSNNNMEGWEDAISEVSRGRPFDDNEILVGLDEAENIEFSRPPATDLARSRWRLDPDDPVVRAVTGGVIGAGGAAALWPDNAMASDGSDENGVPMLPVLGAGAGAATLPFLLRRGRSGRLADEVSNSVGMSGGRPPGSEAVSRRRLGGSGFDSGVNPERGPVSGGQTGTEAVPDLPPLEQTRTNVPRGAPAGARAYLDQRNARILELIEEMQPVRNARSGAANPNARIGERLDNGYRAIAERLREEGYGEVTHNVIKGVVNRSRGRPPSATADAAATGADEAAAQRLGMSVERYRSLSARRRNEAIGAIGLTGAGVALAFGDEAGAEGFDPNGQWIGEEQRRDVGDRTEIRQRFRDSQGRIFEGVRYQDHATGAISAPQFTPVGEAPMPQLGDTYDPTEVPLRPEEIERIQAMRDAEARRLGETPERRQSRAANETEPTTPSWALAAPLVTGVLGGRLGRRLGERSGRSLAGETAGAMTFGGVVGGGSGLFTDAQDAGDLAVFGTALGAGGRFGYRLGQEGVRRGAEAVADIRLPRRRVRGQPLPYVGDDAVTPMNEAGSLRPPPARQPERFGGSLDEGDLTREMAGRAIEQGRGRLRPTPVTMEERMNIPAGARGSLEGRLATLGAEPLRELARREGLPTEGAVRALAQRLADAARADPARIQRYRDIFQALGVSGVIVGGASQLLPQDAQAGATDGESLPNWADDAGIGAGAVGLALMGRAALPEALERLPLGNARLGQMSRVGQVPLDLPATYFSAERSRLGRAAFRNTSPAEAGAASPTVAEQVSAGVATGALGGTGAAMLIDPYVESPQEREARFNREVLPYVELRQDAIDLFMRGVSSREVRRYDPELADEVLALEQGGSEGARRLGVRSEAAPAQ